jgi:hypothetical protein
MAVIDKTVSAWHMNNDWTDAIGSNHGTATGATFDGSTKKLGSHSGAFDKTDDRVDCGDDSSITSLTKGAWGAWIYVPSSLANNTEFVFAGYGGDTEAQVIFSRISIQTDATSANYEVWFRNRTGGVTNNYLTTVNSFGTDTWRLVWVESTGTEYKIYVDNIDELFSVETGNNDGQWLGDIQPGANENVVWGASLVNGVYSKFFGSNIDAGFILNDATTAGDRVELWNGGAGIEIAEAHPHDMILGGQPQIRLHRIKLGKGGITL